MAKKGKGPWLPHGTKSPPPELQEVVFDFRTVLTEEQKKWPVVRLPGMTLPPETPAAERPDSAPTAAPSPNRL
jgi:hypothetical protein